MSQKPLQTVPTVPLTWQQELASAFTEPEQLLKFLNLDCTPVDLHSNLQKTAENFSFLVPISYAERIQKNNPNDPLLLQVIPTVQELITSPGFTENPVGDLEALAIPGLLHKYHGRVLLITSGACPIHCRYCFRRDFPYQNNQSNQRQAERIRDYINQNPEINEVILSGGDPLILTNRRLEQLISGLEEIPHLKRLRIHSRVPTTLPSRIDKGLLILLSETRFQTILVTHINHANELLADPVINALNQLSQAKVRLLNQTVLLRQINDNADCLSTLSEALFDAGISPYYLHMLDKTSGTAHFEVSENNALEIYRRLQSRLPGYLVPKLVREIPGEHSKTLQ